MLAGEPCQHRQIDGVAVLHLGRECGGNEKLVTVRGLHEHGFAQGQAVLGQGPGLVRAEDVHARHFLDGLEARKDRLHPRQRHGAHGHGDRQHCRHGHRDGRDHQDQGELHQIE